MRRGPAFWLAVVAALLVQGALLLDLHRRIARWPLVEFDAAWHLTCGRLILETASVPRQDALAFTTDGVDWINLNWLAQAGLYRAFLACGFTGPVVLGAVAFACTLALTLDRLRARRVAGLAALPALWLTLFLLVGPHSLRPQTFTYTLLAWSAWLLDRPDPEQRLGPGRAALLAATLALWSNLHGGVLLGFALVGLDAIGSMLDARRRGTTWLPRRTRWLLGACAAGALVGFGLHPHGFAALAFAIDYKAAVGAQVLAGTNETLPLSFSTPLGAAVGALLLAAAAGGAVARSHVAARDALPLLFLAWVTLGMQRTAPALGLISIPAAAMLVTRAADAVRERLPAWTGQVEAYAQANLTWFPRLLLAATLAWAALALALARPGVPGDLDPRWLAPAGRPAVNPVAALEHLRTRHPTGRVFNAFQTGGLLEWATFPARRTFIDGRTDLHNLAGSYAEWARISELQPGWQALLDARQVDLALLGAAQPLTVELERAGWRRSFADEAWVVLTRP